MSFVAWLTPLLCLLSWDLVLKSQWSAWHLLPLKVLPFPPSYSYSETNWLLSPSHLSPGLWNLGISSEYSFFRISHIWSVDRYCHVFPHQCLSHLLSSFCSCYQPPASEISASSQSCLLNVIDIWRAEFIFSLNQRHIDDSLLHSSHLAMDI